MVKHFFIFAKKKDNAHNILIKNILKKKIIQLMIDNLVIIVDIHPQ
jgi:hypothetical protein